MNVSKHMTIINVMFIVADTIIAALAIIAFGWGAAHFERWWILLFTILPLVMYSSKSIVVEKDIEDAQKGSGNDA